MLCPLSVRLSHVRSVITPTETLQPQKTPASQSRAPCCVPYPWLFPSSHRSLRRSVDQCQPSHTLNICNGCRAIERNSNCCGKTPRCSSFKSNMDPGARCNLDFYLLFQLAFEPVQLCSQIIIIFFFKRWMSKCLFLLNCPMCLLGGWSWNVWRNRYCISTTVNRFIQ